MNDLIEPLIGIALLILVVSCYLLPAIIARSRGHKSESAIAILNICLGWSLLVWVICLVWAYSDNTHDGENTRIMKEVAIRRQLEIQQELARLQAGA